MVNAALKRKQAYITESDKGLLGMVTMGGLSKRVTFRLEELDCGVEVSTVSLGGFVSMDQSEEGAREVGKGQIMLAI